MCGSVHQKLGHTNTRRTLKGQFQQSRRGAVCLLFLLSRYLRGFSIKVTPGPSKQGGQVGYRPQPILWQIRCLYFNQGGKIIPTSLLRASSPLIVRPSYGPDLSSVHELVKNACPYPSYDWSLALCGPAFYPISAGPRPNPFFNMFIAVNVERSLWNKSTITKPFVYIFKKCKNGDFRRYSQDKLRW